MNAPVPLTREGQRFFDEPVYVEVSRAVPLSLAVNDAFIPRQNPPVVPFCNSQKPVPGTVMLRPKIEVLSHHNRISLRWLTPDGKGGFVPKRR